MNLEKRQLFDFCGMSVQIVKNNGLRVLSLAKPFCCSPEIGILIILNIRPSCHTLSNAFNV